MDPLAPPASPAPDKRSLLKQTFLVAGGFENVSLSILPKYN